MDRLDCLKLSRTPFWWLLSTDQCDHICDGLNHKGNGVVLTSKEEPMCNCRLACLWQCSWQPVWQQYSQNAFFNLIVRLILFILWTAILHFAETGLSLTLNLLATWESCFLGFCFFFLPQKSAENLEEITASCLKTAIKIHVTAQTCKRTRC